eukprot:TRINITY_DN9910_c0_g1_i2.p1 TRINITY_DN9910_c0_g1~~TRINITY_DN9910_c0_g1_i2.p1  ORF type:complete len:255 (-),score=58.51 TRINITY_DN9910_c0_g1_i2:42-806(-)
MRGSVLFFILLLLIAEVASVYFCQQSGDALEKDSYKKASRNHKPKCNCHGLTVWKECTHCDRRLSSSDTCNCEGEKKAKELRAIKRKLNTKNKSDESEKKEKKPKLIITIQEDKWSQMPSLMVRGVRIPDIHYPTKKDSLPSFEDSKETLDWQMFDKEVFDWPLPKYDDLGFMSQDNDFIKQEADSFPPPREVPNTEKEGIFYFESKQEMNEQKNEMWQDDWLNIPTDKFISPFNDANIGFVDEYFWSPESTFL